MECEADLRKLSLSLAEGAGRGSQPLSPLNVHVFTETEPQCEIPHTREGTFRVPSMPLPFTVVFIFLS